MITIQLRGGLGNQLFQIFFLLSYCKKYKLKYFLKNEIYGMRKKTYWNNIFKEVNNFDNKQLLGRYTELCFNYINLEKMDNVIFYGNFISYKYFKKYLNSLISLLKIDEMKSEIKKKHGNLSSITSIHFKIKSHKIKNKYFTLLDYKYYKKCLEYLKPKKVMCFYENIDEYDVEKIIIKLKKDFPEIEFNKCHPKLDDWEHLLQMSICENNILSNSLFSLWGGYLNSNKNKKVLYPSNWFGEKLNMYTTYDLFPENWIEI